MGLLRSGSAVYFLYKEYDQSLTELFINSSDNEVIIEGMISEQP